MHSEVSVWDCSTGAQRCCVSPTPRDLWQQVGLGAQSGHPDPWVAAPLLSWRPWSLCISDEMEDIKCLSIGRGLRRWSLIVQGTEVTYYKEKPQTVKQQTLGEGKDLILRIATLLESNVQFQTTKNHKAYK